MLEAIHIKATAIAWGVVAASGLLTARGQSSESCTHVQTIVRAADTDFRSIRGDAIETRATSVERWETTTGLPGATNCGISRRRADGNTSYTCDWEIADESRLEQQYQMFVDAIPSCFPGVQPQISEERASEFEPGRLRPALARFDLAEQVSLSIRKWTAASSRADARISFRVTRSAE